MHGRVGILVQSRCCFGMQSLKEKKTWTHLVFHLTARRQEAATIRTGEEEEKKNKFDLLPENKQRIYTHYDYDLLSVVNK